MFSVFYIFISQAVGGRPKKQQHKFTETTQCCEQSTHSDATVFCRQQHPSKPSVLNSLMHKHHPYPPKYTKYTISKANKWVCRLHIISFSPAYHSWTSAPGNGLYISLLTFYWSVWPSDPTLSNWIISTQSAVRQDKHGLIFFTQSVVRQDKHGLIFFTQSVVRKDKHGLIIFTQSVVKQDKHGLIFFHTKCCEKRQTRLCHTSLLGQILEKQLSGNKPWWKVTKPPPVAAGKQYILLWWVTLLACC